jgi:tellurite methyltransferase
MDGRMQPVAPALAPGAIATLDVRDAVEFARGHRRGCGHLPVDELASRRAELPPRGTPLLVIAADGARAQAAAAILETLGYAGVLWLDAPAGALPGGLDDRGPAQRLWRPAPFLVEVLPTVRSALAARGDVATPRALDLACGAGREVVHLAGQGFDAEGWDHDAEVLERARSLARREGLTLRTSVRDLERGPLEPPPVPFELITCFRFLHRPLFEWIERALAPGGWLVYETFRVGQERHGRPRRAQFLLQPGELGRAFPTLEIVRCEEPEPGDGDVVSRLLARRPPGNP